MDIEKKIWPEYFEKIIAGDKNFELRLADFEIKEGDNLILREYDKENGYTGRIINKVAKAVCKFDAEEISLNCDEGLFQCYTQEQLNKFGYYWIGI